MHLKIVTLTGADDTVTPHDLRFMSKNHPFLEWGILISHKREGTPRFPSVAWINELARCASGMPAMRISAHLCGEVLRDLMVGGNKVFLHYAPLLAIAQRIQLNFHAEPQTVKVRLFLERVQQRRFDMIFQHDGLNDDIMQDAIGGMGSLAFTSRCVPLYDASHGAGVYPAEWPTPKLGPKMIGFAGGIGPENVLTAILQIAARVTDDTETWIDMESHLRTNNQFDLTKCLAVARACDPLVDK